MLKVLPIQSKDEQAALCARCAMPYRPECMAYHALVDGTVVGVCQFVMNEHGGFIRGLALTKEAEVISAPDRAEAIFVMGRATLNFIDLCGVHDAYFEDTDFEDEGMIKAIGFRKNGEDRWYMNLEGFFTSSPCKHCHD